MTHAAPHDRSTRVWRGSVAMSHKAICKASTPHTSQNGRMGLISSYAVRREGDRALYPPWP